VNLVSADVLARAEATGWTSEYNRSMLDDPVAGPSLRYYLLLTEKPEVAASRGYSPEEIFWSRYFWFQCFARLWQTGHGPDAGIEHQAFQILEYPQPTCCPDWSHLEEVEAGAEKHARERLGG
jgi:hypothetical protein